MPIEVEAPNGTIVEFPDGTSREEIARAMQRAFPSDAVRRERESRQRTDRFFLRPGGLTEEQRRRQRVGEREFLNGSTLGLFGLGIAALNEATDLPRTLRGEQKFGERFDAARRVDNEERARYPGMTLGMNVVGGLPTAAASGLPRLIAGRSGGGNSALLRAVQSPKLVPTVARGAVAGGGTGAVAGAAASNPGEELTDAARGAKVGAVIGGGVPAAGAALSKAFRSAPARTVARAANKATGGKLLDPQAEATRRLVEALEKDAQAAGLKPTETQQFLADRVAEWQRTGVAPALIDAAGENTRGLVRGAAMTGEGRGVAVDYGNRTAADLQDNAIWLTRALTPDTRPASAVVDEVSRARMLAGRQMYPAFADARVPMGDDLLSASSGMAGEAYINKAIRLADAERNPGVIAELQALHAGAAKDISAGALDYLRRGMRDAADEAFQGGSGQLGSALKDRSKEIETALMDVPGFDMARKTWAGFSRELDALKGEYGTALSAMPDDFSGRVGQLDDRALDALRIRSRQDLTDAIGRPAEGATGVLNRVASSTNTGRNLSELYGPETAETYRAGVGNLVEQINNARFINPNTGAQTAGRMADETLVELPPASGPGLIQYVLGKIQRGATLTDAERKTLVQLGVMQASDLRLPAPTDPRLLASAVASSVTAPAAAGQPR